jgi:four helix bundle protein
VSEGGADAPVAEALPYARSFYELRVYERSRALAREIFKITQRFPKDETYSLTDQWRRAARSIGAQIAEAWAKRRYPKNFVSKLSDADGEQLETQHWTIAALDAGYITREEAHHLGSIAKEIGRMLGEMMRDADSFCRADSSPILRDSPNEDFPSPEPPPTDH